MTLLLITTVILFVLFARRIWVEVRFNNNHVITGGIYYFIEAETHHAYKTRGYRIDKNIHTGKGIFVPTVLAEESDWHMKTEYTIISDWSPDVIHNRNKLTWLTLYRKPANFDEYFSLTQPNE